MIDKRPARIAAMFDAISGRYDLLNHLLSGGLDRRWRRRAIRSLRLKGTERVLDVCTGTGDLAFAALDARPPAARVVGIDMAAAMLARARAKAGELGGMSGRGSGTRSVLFVRGDAARLPVATASADGVMVAFGVRNVAALQTALGEFHRVLRPAGRLAILEFGLPASRLLSAACRAYVHTVVPALGWLISGDRHAYRYLPNSVDDFPAGETFAQLLRSAGFDDVRAENLAPGIVYLYSAVQRVQGG